MKVWRRIATDTLIYGSADFVSKLIIFASFPIVAARLSTEVFGVFELVMSLTNILGLLANVGLNNAAQRYYWDGETGEAGRSRLVSTGLLLLTFTTTGISAIFLFAALTVEASDIVKLGAYGLSLLGVAAALGLMVAMQITQYILDVLRLQFRPWHFFTFALIARAGAAIALVFAVVLRGQSLDGMFVSQFILVFLALPLGVWLIRSDLTPRLDGSFVKPLLQYGYPFIFVTSAFWLMASMDRWMIASMMSVSDVGLYSIASRFATITLFCSTAFGMAWSPWSIKLRTDSPNTYRRSYAGLLVAMLSVMLFICTSVALFASEILVFLMPVEYHLAAPAFVLIVLSVAIQSSHHIAAVGISLEKRTPLLARVAWIAVGINLVFNLTLIGPFGIVGAAWATVLANVGLIWGYFHYSQKLHPIPIRWGYLAALGAIWGIVCVISLNTMNYDLNITVIGAKSVGLFALVVVLIPLVRGHAWRVGIDEDGAAT
ncbi:oligosaccharide flippase family protein [uncultured Roseobacter sp.]|uniref:oligosaccharide flippase family protein n=1 Tax=uncultured Roseobacter sp. TaxID=114847 RepID=UPI002614E35C|nr:oligosaccharide flippase family protein [uncultured Roseobacter sp.]